MGSTLPRHHDRPRHVPARQDLSWRHEVGYVLMAMVVYFGVRILVEGSDARSFSNADRLLDLEATLNVDIEAAVQGFAIDSAIFRTTGNLSYVWLHWPLLIAAMVLVSFRDPLRYRQLRNALFASGAAGLVLFTVVPMAPPRFMPGFIGTVSDDARRHYISYPLSWANKYAAFPSFHVGWTLIACLAVAATIDRRRLRVVALIPALMVGVAVITTGNHYVLDSVAGAAIALAAYGGAGWALRPEQRGTVPGLRSAAAAHRPFHRVREVGS